MASKLPYVPIELLEYLETIIPDKMPVSYTTEFDLGKAAGSVIVVRKLRQLYDDQVKASLGQGELNNVFRRK